MKTSIEDAQILWIYGLLSAEDLTDIATEALLDGSDNDPLRILAGLGPSERDEAPLYFERVLAELGLAAPTEHEAIVKLGKIICRKIVDGETDPYEGAKTIWKASIKSRTNFKEVGPFIYAASEYEDRPEDREWFANEIRKEAARWVG